MDSTPAKRETQTGFNGALPTAPLHLHSKIIAMQANLFGGNPKQRDFDYWLSAGSSDYQDWPPPCDLACTWIVIGGLSQVLGAAVHFGTNTADGSVVLESISAAGVDQVCGIPGFGHALESVGWLEDVEGGVLLTNDVMALARPREVAETTSKTPAERSRQYRKRSRERSQRDARHEARDEQRDADVTERDARGQLALIRREENVA